MLIFPFIEDAVDPETLLSMSQLTDEDIGNLVSQKAKEAEEKAKGEKRKQDIHARFEPKRRALQLEFDAAQAVLKAAQEEYTAKQKKSEESSCAAGRAATAAHVLQAEANHHGIEAALAKKAFIEAEAKVADIHTRTGKLIKARDCSLNSVQPEKKGETPKK